MQLPNILEARRFAQSLHRTWSAALQRAVSHNGHPRPNRVNQGRTVCVIVGMMGEHENSCRSDLIHGALVIAMHTHTVGVRLSRSSQGRSKYRAARRHYADLRPLYRNRLSRLHANSSSS